MGVYRIDYIVYGWKLPYKLKDSKGIINFDDDKFLPYIEGRKGVKYTIIRDGMDGKYTVFGKLIKQTDSDDYNCGWGFTNLDFSNHNTEEIKSKYREVFNLEENEIMTEPYLFIFSHYS